MYAADSAVQEYTAMRLSHAWEASASNMTILAETMRRELDID